MNKKSELLPPLFVDIDETAELLRIGRSSVYKLINEEKLKATKFGRRTVLRYADVVAFADEVTA
jgi:excisionase family DNA binding protein